MLAAAIEDIKQGSLGREGGGGKEEEGLAAEAEGDDGGQVLEAGELQCGELLADDG